MWCNNKTGFIDYLLAFETITICKCFSECEPLFLCNHQWAIYHVDCLVLLAAHWLIPGLVSTEECSFTSYSLFCPLSLPVDPQSPLILYHPPLSPFPPLSLCCSHSVCISLPPSLLPFFSLMWGMKRAWASLRAGFYLLNNAAVETVTAPPCLSLVFPSPPQVVTPLKDSLHSLILTSQQCGPNPPAALSSLS